MQLTYQALSLPLEFTFTISRGSLQEAQTVTVSLQCQYAGRTHTGLGEAVPARFYGEDQASVCAFYDRLSAEGALAGLDPFNGQDFEARMTRYEGHSAGKSGLDQAIWDLRGKITGLPVWKLLGLDAARAPKSSYTIGIADLDIVRRKTLTALERGYDILKVKLGSPEDLACLELIKSLAPDATIRVDANAAWTIDDALPMMTHLHGMGVEFVEEPLRLDSPRRDYERLFAESPLLLMADESCHTLRDIPRCAEVFGAVNLKHTKTGGLSEALRMIHAARAHGLKIMLGCFCESSVSIAAFAQLSPLVDYADLDGALLVAEDPYDGLRFEGSRFILGDRPGLGVTPKA